MAENDKGLGSKFLGLFVEQGQPKEDDGTAPSPAEQIAELARKSTGGAPGAAAAAAAAPTPVPGLKIEKMAASGGAPADFDAVFREAGMDGGELDRVKKAEELLRGLPDATPQDVKRQIVEASLKAFGFELEKIVVAA